MSNWQYANIVPTKQFRSANALPRELGLYEQDGEFYVSITPVKEVRDIRKEVREISTFMVDTEYHVDTLLNENSGAYEIEMQFINGSKRRERPYGVLRRSLRGNIRVSR